MSAPKPPVPDHPPSLRALLRCRHVKMTLSTRPALVPQPSLPGCLGLIRAGTPPQQGQMAQGASPTSQQVPEARKPPPLTRKLPILHLSPGAQRPSPVPLSQQTLPELLTRRPMAHLCEKKPPEVNLTHSGGANK